MATTDTLDYVYFVVDRYLGTDFGAKVKFQYGIIQINSNLMIGGGVTKGEGERESKKRDRVGMQKLPMMV